MDTTMNLLDRALKQHDKSAADWCRELHLSRNTLAAAKVRGRLSPTIAGNLARLMGEPVEHWIAVAAMEAEPDSVGKQTLLKKAGAWSVRTSLYFFGGAQRPRRSALWIASLMQPTLTPNISAN